MFVWSMKTTRPRLTAYGVVVALLMMVLVMGRDTPSAQVSSNGADAKRVGYLQQQGYTVEPRWTDVREVVVPASAAVPAAYQGKRVKCFTYAVKGGAPVRLYEYNGMIIGTDLFGEGAEKG